MGGSVMARDRSPDDRATGSKLIVGTPQPGPNTGPRGGGPNASGRIRRGSPPGIWPRGSKTGRAHAPSAC